MRPKPVQDERLVFTDPAFAGVVAGMAGTVVRGPGERKQIVVELAFSPGVVVAMVMFGERGGSE